MTPEENVVTWLISLGALHSPKMLVNDPVHFLKTSLKDGVVLCKLILRLLPESIDKYCPEPKTEADCITNIEAFLTGCAALKVKDLGQRTGVHSVMQRCRPANHPLVKFSILTARKGQFVDRLGFCCDDGA